MTITQNTKHTHNDFLEEIENVIREMGKPLHIKTIHKMLLEKGVPIPGKGNEANVIARIQRSEGRIIRTGRGSYGLPDFNLDEVKPVKRLRKSMRRNK